MSIIKTWVHWTFSSQYCFVLCFSCNWRHGLQWYTPWAVFSHVFRHSTKHGMARHRVHCRACDPAWRSVRPFTASCLDPVRNITGQVCRSYVDTVIKVTRSSRSSFIMHVTSTEIYDQMQIYEPPENFLYSTSFMSFLLCNKCKGTFVTLKFRVPGKILSKYRQWFALR